MRRRGVAEFERYAAEHDVAAPFDAVTRLYEVMRARVWALCVYVRVCVCVFVCVCVCVFVLCLCVLWFGG